MAYEFICYPKCTTCQKAKKWLLENQIPFQERHIVENNPTTAELTRWSSQSGLPIKKFFNTSGLQYKERGLKDKLPGLSEAEQVELLASHGMLVKRPLLIGSNEIRIGFRQEEWERLKGTDLE